MPLVHTAKNTQYICDSICDHAIVDTITLSRQIARRPRDRDDRVIIDDALSSSYSEIEMRGYDSPPFAPPPGHPPPSPPYESKVEMKILAT